MPLSEDQLERLTRFLSDSDFIGKGAVISDLDGTVLHEHQGRTIIHNGVEDPLKALYGLGRPVLLNTLRFPLSVIRTIGNEWYNLARNPIPVILLNGSQLGFISRREELLLFEPLHNEPLTGIEIGEVLDLIRPFVDTKMPEPVLFYYPAEWTKGEIIWTPSKEEIPFLEKRYRSASRVFSSGVAELEENLSGEAICMIFLLFNNPGDGKMAYQHSARSQFFTHKGIDKAAGTRKMQELLNFEAIDSIGAGDSEMDNFLNETGLSLVVGRNESNFNGRSETIYLPDFNALGAAFSHIAAFEFTTLISK